MSWNPSIKFKLRDDQVAFGDLIFDKNGASLICEILHDIKDGKPINTEAFAQVLNEWCFTDAEFERLKQEFEDIKQDIAKFKQISTSFGHKWTASVKSIGVAVDYVAGSATWIQKYKENKAIAAGLYQNVKKSGYQFSEAEKQEYEKRYFDVMQESTETELVEAFLQKQYRESLAAGDKDALDKYCDALVETGCITPEAAAKKKQMLGYFANAQGGNFRDAQKQGTNETANATYTEQKSSGGGNKFVIVDQDAIKDWFDKVSRLDKEGFPAEADSALHILYSIMLKVYEEAGVPYRFDVDTIIDTKDKAWQYALRLNGILSMSQNRGLIECADVKIPMSEVEKLESYISCLNTGRWTKPVINGYVTICSGEISQLVSKLVIDRSAQAGDILMSIHNVVCHDNVWPNDIAESVISGWYAVQSNVKLIEDACTQIPEDKLKRVLV